MTSYAQSYGPISPMNDLKKSKIVLIYLLVPLIIQKFSKILRADP